MDDKENYETLFSIPFENEVTMLISLLRYAIDYWPDLSVPVYPVLLSECLGFFSLSDKHVISSSLGKLRTGA